MTTMASLEDIASFLRVRLAGHPLVAAASSSEAWPFNDVPPADFRGDTNFVWQARASGGDRASYDAALRAAHSLVVNRDCFGFIDAMREDGSFGAQCAHAASGELISRDIVDSANELCFLQEQLRICSWPAGACVVDIGGGYGRLAVRLWQALPKLCVLSSDGVPGSLAAAHIFLRHCAVPDERIVPPDEIEKALERTPPRLAIAVHSLPEMRLEATRRWLRLVHARGAAHLFVVSNVRALTSDDMCVGWVQTREHHRGTSRRHLTTAFACADPPIRSQFASAKSVRDPHMSSVSISEALSVALSVSLSYHQACDPVYG